MLSPRIARPVSVLTFVLVTIFNTAELRADGALPSDPIFKALLIDGSPVIGRISKIGPDGALTLSTSDGKDETLPIDSLVKLSRNGWNTPTVPEASVVLFPEGDRIYRTAIGAANETTLDVQSFSLGHLSIPLDSLLGLVLALPTDSRALDELIVRVRTESRAKEVVWLANGDRLVGGFLGLTDRVVEFQPAKDPIKIERTGVTALGFDPALVSYPRPEGSFYECTLTDGTRLGVVGPKVDRGHLIAKSRFGASLNIPLADLLRLHTRSPHVVYLSSEREPAADKYVAYLGPSRPYRRDLSVEGHPIRLGGQDIDRGLGTESRTLLAYKLEPGDKRFQAEVGLDDRAGPLGSVVFRVLADNNERFVSPAMSSRDTPRRIDVDISGAKLLILITEYGERGGVRDVADWGEARVIR